MGGFLATTDLPHGGEGTVSLARPTMRLQRSLRLVGSLSSGEVSTSGARRFDPSESVERGKTIVDLGNGSEVLHVPRFIPTELSWKWFDYLDRNIPWSRPTLRIFDRDSIQPRDSCYVADEGLPKISYSGHTPHAYSWNDYPPLRDILDVVHRALPGSSFNSLVLNRYGGGNDHVSWHSDEEVVYGPTPDIASVTFGCEREFLLKKKAPGASKGSCNEPARKRAKSDFVPEQHSFTLKHGSLLVMRGYTQRDWVHSVPKRAKAMSTRINLTFRCVLL
ncbi:hypothetical protein MLD38_021038 [Melastoma candidum]|uniref:Uncharacterized protein n=1 Tax=Melastoma candidum TaxID=119954 RepID=A0ACB9QI87_9MYRT|nr:hypothetical protein MLD38_021038 [Melastoma candidum]